MLKHFIHSPVYYRFYSVLKNEKSFHTFFNFRQNGLYNLANLNFHTSLNNKTDTNYNENDHAQSIVEKIQPWLVKSNTIINHEVTQLEDINEVFLRNWRNAPSSEIVDAFKKLKKFCIKNNINISDERFDNLVDGVLDNCEHFSKDQIIDLLTCMVELPPCLGYSSHNFHDLWSCLDDISCWKMVDWDIDTSLQVGNLWSRLHLGKLGDFTFVLLDRLVKRADMLNKNQLVTIFNFFNVCRSRAVDFEYEYALEKLVDEMNVDELAVVALGYFKTKTKIKLVSILRTMIEKVEQSSEHIHEISLTAILKILRYSNSGTLFQEVDRMLDKISKEIPRLSHLSCLHIALLGTGFLQVYHPETLKKVCDKLVPHISNPEKVRLKDIERILLALTMFDFDPKTNPDIFKECYAEIHKQSRIVEEVKYSRALVSTLNYLSIKNLYSYDLMNRVLDQDYIENIYGKSARLLPRELLVLDCSIDIECPGYKGSRLTVEQRYRGAKWLTEYLPTTNYKLSQLDKLFLSVLETVKKIVGNNSVSIQHVVPHFVKADIILCKDKRSDKFIEPFGFERYVLGDVMFPYKDENLEWYVFVLIHWTNTVRNLNSPFGMIRMKMRQLEKLGYKPLLVVWRDFEELTPENKKLHILQKLKC